jgi:hypothetical protein
MRAPVSGPIEQNFDQSEIRPTKPSFLSITSKLSSDTPVNHSFLSQILSDNLFPSLPKLIFHGQRQHGFTATSAEFFLQPHRYQDAHGSPP